MVKLLYINIEIRAQKPRSYQGIKYKTVDFKYRYYVSDILSATRVQATTDHDVRRAPLIKIL